MNGQRDPNNIGASAHAEINSPGPLTAPRICHNPNCGFQTHQPLRRCPKCGRPMWTTHQFRLLSLVLVLCGGVLAALGIALILILANTTSGLGAPSARQIKGGIFFLGIFGFILAFGLSVLAAGLWQVIFGRANLRLIYIVLTFLLALMMIVAVGRSLLRLAES